MDIPYLRLRKLNPQRDYQRQSKRGLIRDVISHNLHY